MMFTTEVAIFALLKTNMQGLNEAIFYVTEKYDQIDAATNQVDKMQHPFLGYLPETKEDREGHTDREQSLLIDDRMADLEEGKGEQEICYICKHAKFVHVSDQIIEQSIDNSVNQEDDKGVWLTENDEIVQGGKDTKNFIIQEINTSRSQKAASLKLQMMNSIKKIEQEQKIQEDEVGQPTYCAICYTNIIIDDKGVKQ